MHFQMNKRTPVKQKLLNILKREHQRTIKEIMIYFEISEIAVRRHIHELEQQGFLNKRSVKQEIGRPYYTYELTKKGHATFPNEDSTLPLELLKDLEHLQGEQAVSDVLSQRMKREQEVFLTATKDKDFDEKIAAITALQDKKGFMVEYDRTAEGDYEIKNFNCPIINIATTYQQVCTNEKKVLSDVFSDSKVFSKSCIAHGEEYCKWTITKPRT